MKYLIVPLVSFLLLLYVFNDAEMNTNTLAMVCVTLITISMASLFMKFRKDKQEGKLTWQRQGVSLLFIIATLLYGIYDYFSVI